MWAHSFHATLLFLEDKMEKNIVKSTNKPILQIKIMNLVALTNSYSIPTNCISKILNKIPFNPPSLVTKKQ